MGDSKFKLGFTIRNKKAGDNAKRHLIIGPAEIGGDILEPCLFKEVSENESAVIPSDEPLFIMRAKDALSIKALRVYMALALEAECPDEFIRAVIANIERFEKWQSENGNMVKNPD